MRFHVRSLVVAGALLAVACGGKEAHPSGAVSVDTPSGPCVDVSHEGALQRMDFRVVASGFEEYEGMTVRVLVTLGEPDYALGEAPIRNGAFELFFPGALADYTGVAVHVDRNRDGACNPESEFIWQRTTGPLSALALTRVEAGVAVWEFTPAELRIFEAVGPCNLNGIFDLSVPLPAPQCSEASP